MTKIALFTLGMVIAAKIVFAAERDHRFVEIFQFPTAPEFAVVAEGDFEPRSVGSYTLRVYGGSSEKFPLDDFIVGLVRPRSGIVEAVRFDDVDGDDKPEIAVVLRAVGSGGYVSADAFRYRSRSLEFIGSVSDLDKRADAIQALRDKFRLSNGSGSSTR
ncbi:MAG TPA: PliI family lysozyme inhibitor of I-type lysozyme [Candidatus Binatia bacterium]|jgi:hypothetical protein